MAPPPASATKPVPPVAAPLPPTPAAIAAPAASAAVAAPERTVAPSPALAASIIAPRFDADYLHNPTPAYPAVARRLGEEGRVLLRVLVSPAGRAERLELQSSSGSTRLDNAALDAVKRWRFVPAHQGSEPVSAWVLVPVSFSLEG